MRYSNSEILCRFRAGLPLDHIPVLDLHTHMGMSSESYYIPFSSAEAQITQFKRYGIDHVLTFAINVATDAKTKNEWLYDFSKDHEQYFSTLTTLHAGFPQDWREILQQGFDAGTRGIKLLAKYQNVPEHKVDWSAALDFAKDKNWCVLNHDWGGLELLEPYVKNFPGVTFFIGHSELRYKKLLEKYDNLYQSTCAAFVASDGIGMEFATIGQLFANLPLEKLLHGSDTIDLDPSTSIGPIAYADIPEHAKEKILGYNGVSLVRKLKWDIPGADYLC